ncbi:helix-turn-helix domain-containing protein [Reyranella sp.]|uniref:helix-turn-helix domain-containing protein n=1 Tax=Reyranella sp. TaxID=1929291 RepID=UPI00403701D2
MSFIRQASSGHYEDLVAQRARVLAICPPSHRRRILGQAPRYRHAKTHEITVDLKSGQRKIASAEATKPVVQSIPAPHSPLPIEAREIVTCEANGRRMTASAIIEAVSAVWGIPVVDLHSPRCSKRISRPRFACFHLLRLMLKFSSPKIGRILGGRDHSTVLAGIDRAKDLYEHDADWRSKFDAVVAVLDGGAK